MGLRFSAALRVFVNDGEGVEPQVLILGLQMNFSKQVHCFCAGQLCRPRDRVLTGICVTERAAWQDEVCSKTSRFQPFDENLFF